MHIRFIYNPKSGRERSQEKVSNIIKYLFEDGHEVSMRFTKQAYDATKFAIEAEKDNVDRLVVVGGDGTVNEVVCGLQESNSKIPVMIMPGGTTNDFAVYMGLQKDDWDTYKTIVSGRIESVDCGKVAGKYFMNVGACGILTDVAHNTPVGLKSAFGRAAYVMKALTELTPENLKPIKMNIESEEVSGEYISYMALVANSKSVGGFQKMAPLASVNDGLLDVLVVREMPLSDLVTDRKSVV